MSVVFELKLVYVSVGNFRFGIHDSGSNMFHIICLHETVNVMWLLLLVIYLVSDCNLEVVYVCA